MNYYRVQDTNIMERTHRRTQHTCTHTHRQNRWSYRWRPYNTKHLVTYASSQNFILLIKVYKYQVFMFVPCFRFNLDMNGQWQQQFRLPQALSTWNELVTSIIKNSFLKCYISNNIDGTGDDVLCEDHQVHSDEDDNGELYIMTVVIKFVVGVEQLIVTVIISVCNFNFIFFKNLGSFFLTYKDLSGFCLSFFLIVLLSFQMYSIT